MLPSWQENRPMAQLTALVLLMLALFLAFKTWQSFRESLEIGKPVPYEHSISLEGIGKAIVAPDVAKVTFSVETRNKVLPDAQTENSKVTNALIEKMKSLGMEPQDIQTTYYSSYEDRYYNPQNGESTPTGWIVSQSIELVIRDLKNISNILAAAGQNGATNISGPNFQVENDSEALNVARTEAIADAQKRAQSVADQLGLKLFEMTGYSEWKEDPGMYNSYASSDSGGSKESPAIMPGSQTVKLHVTLSYTFTE